MLKPREDWNSPQLPEALSASQLEKKAAFKTKWENVFPKHADGIVPNFPFSFEGSFLL
jgi:hypothetical protein